MVGLSVGNQLTKNNLLNLALRLSYRLYIIFFCLYNLLFFIFIFILLLLLCEYFSSTFTLIPPAFLSEIRIETFPTYIPYTNCPNHDIFFYKNYNLLIIINNYIRKYCNQLQFILKWK